MRVITLWLTLPLASSSTTVSRHGEDPITYLEVVAGSRSRVVSDASVRSYLKGYSLFVLIVDTTDAHYDIGRYFTNTPVQQATFNTDSCYSAKLVVK